jgi:ABC-type amino acid transport substrate-binding protein
MDGVVESRWQEEEPLISAHSCAESASVGALLRQQAVVLSPVLSRLVKATMAAAVALCLVQQASAQSPKVAFAILYSGTLKKINESGEIRIGYRENSPPLAFLDEQRKPLGYSLDLCEVVVEEIAAELGKDIRVIRRPVTPENRFELVNSGEVDLECVRRRTILNAARPWRFRQRCSSPAPSCWCGGEAGS